MNKEELLELLRKNLTISITAAPYYDQGFRDHKVEVEIRFDGEFISSSKSTILT